MSHILASAIKMANRGGADESHPAAHQPGTSPPLSPVDPRDIELTAPPNAASRPPSPEVQIKRTTSKSIPASDPSSIPSLGLANLAQGSTTEPPPPSLAIPPPPSPPTTFAQAVQQNGAPEPGAATPAPTVYSETDPLLLRTRLVADHDLRRRASVTGVARRRKKENQLASFYSRQNQHIEALLKPARKHAEEDEAVMAAVSWKIRALVNANIFANFALAALQLYAAVSSLSLSLFATAADSIFDPFANLLLNWVHRKSERLDRGRWPVGGTRVESVGNIVYAFVMGSVSLILIVESARDLATHQDGDTKQLHVPSLIAVGVAFVTKAALGFMNFALRKYSSQLDMLWEDCRNDLFINGFGIFTSAAGAKIAWWIDPMGATIISVLIIILWGRTATEQFQQLCGKAAPPELLQLLTYQAFLHPVEQIESVKAYSCGSDKYWVEMHIVLPKDTPLHRSHDVGEALEASLEELPAVDRAFVHADYDITHDFEHEGKKSK